MPCTVKDHRRARFVELLNGPFKGDRAAFMRAARLTKGRITQLLDPEQPFGDTAARRLIERLHLPQDYFDSTAPSAAGQAVADAYEKMSPGQQELFLRLLEASFGAPVVGRPKELGHSDFMDIELDFGEENGRRAAQKDHQR